MLNYLFNIYSGFTTTINSQLNDTPEHEIIFITASITLATSWFIKKAVATYLNYRPAQHASTIQKEIYNTIRTLPMVNTIVDKILFKQTEKVIEDFYKEAAAAANIWQGPSKLPLQGLPLIKITEKFQAVLKPMPEIVSEIHKVSGNIYTLYSEEFIAFLGTLMARTALLNPMHNNTSTIMARMEANVIEICRDLFHAAADHGGSINHGGSTSIFEALKAYTFYARDIKKISRPNVIVPSTIHVAFYKAAQILNIDIITVPVNIITGKADVAAMEQQINKQTIALVGSAPSFMAGIIDPIAELGQIAQKHNIGLHVDSCLGGFLTAFTHDAGININELCDFRVPGVTSISADLHKYGATIKGVSILLLGNMTYKSFGINKQFSLSDMQAQAYADWPGGFYVTKTIDGSRSLLQIASCLATLLYLGRNYYVDTAKKIIEVKNKILEQIKQDLKTNQQSVFKHIDIIGEPKLSIIGFKSESKEVNIHQVATRMNKHFKWDLNLLQNPNSFHICLTAASLTKPDIAQDFYLNLKNSIIHTIANPNIKASGAAELYCSKAKIPAFSSAIMERLAKAYVHIIYSWWPREEETKEQRYHPFR